MNKQTKKSVSYAHLQHKTLHLITQANNDGVYVFKVPNEFANDSIIVSCVSYEKRTIAIKDLLRQSKIELKPDPTQLKSITISALPTGKSILDSVRKHIKDNYHTDTTINTFFCRTYSIIDSNLYVFDEAIFDILRCGADRKTGGFGYVFSKKSNFKKPQKYRLLVYDTLAVDSLLISQEFKRGLYSYDEENLYDVTEFPKIALIFKQKKHFTYDVSRIIGEDNNVLLKVIATQKKNFNNIDNIELVVNPQNYALLSIIHNQKKLLPDSTDMRKTWAINNLYYKCDYIKMSEKYTLSKNEDFWDVIYYDSVARPHPFRFLREYYLMSIDTSKNRINEIVNDTTIINRKVLKYDEAFDNSKYDEDFWQQYNFVPLDTDIYEQLKTTLNKRR